MKTIKQMMRQPTKTIAGIMLVSLAVATLVVCAGQYLAAETAMDTLDYQFNTVALPARAGNYKTVDVEQTGMTIKTEELPEEIAAWIDQNVAEHPELVKLDSRPGLASAYIPELTPDLYVQHDYRHTARSSDILVGSMIPKPEGAPYTCAMLEVTIVSIEPLLRRVFVQDLILNTDVVDGTQIRCVIDRVHSLPEGYHDPTGYFVDLSMNGVTPEEVSAGGFETGGHYLVYGTDYYDWDWYLREAIRVRQKERYNSEVIIDEFDPDGLIYYTDEQIKNNRGGYVADYKHGYKTINLTKNDVKQFRSVELTDPKLVRLEGDAEAFLASEAGAQWRVYLEYAEVNNHAFPFIGVDKLGYIGSFAQETARIVEGRDFTQDELDNGVKVCVMAESLAAANGLSVGDTIHPQYYNFDPEMEGQYLLSSGYGTTEPTAYFFGENTPFAGEAEAYTIVGLYRAPEWQNPDKDLYCFTPNTIFVPKNSVTAAMDYADQAFFRTIVLGNGKIPEFMQLVSDAGYEGLFVCYDQGYSEIADTFGDFETVTRQAAFIGVLMYGVIILLFLLLFPGRHGKVMATMASLGAQRRHKISHVVVSSLSILIPGTMIGAGVGMLLWGEVSNALQETSKVMIHVELDVGSILAVALIQLAITLLLAAAIAVCASKPKKM